MPVDADARPLFGDLWFGLVELVVHPVLTADFNSLKWGLTGAPCSPNGRKLRSTDQQNGEEYAERNDREY